MQKTAVKEDLRVQRTHQLLRDALFSETIERGFTTVTVRDITNRARVNRSTFYRHYLDKYDLLNQYLDELQSQITDAASLAEQPMTLDAPPIGLLMLLRHIQTHAAFFRVMLGPNGDPGFTYRIRQFSEDRYRALISHSPGPTHDMRLSYISSATVGVILWWLEHDQPLTPEQLSVALGQLNLSNAGLSGGISAKVPVLTLRPD